MWAWRNKTDKESGISTGPYFPPELARDEGRNGTISWKTIDGRIEGMLNKRRSGWKVHII